MTISHSSASPPAELGAAGRLPPDRTPAAPPFSGKVRPIEFSAPMVRALLEGRKTQTRRLFRGQIESADLPRVSSGDRLWVKERYAKVPPAGARYEATDAIHELRKVIAGRFMPRAYSRLTLAVTEVRVQRLHDISEADAIAEGIELMRETSLYGRHWRNYGAEGMDDRSATHSYRTLWNSLRGHTGVKKLPVEPWSENPWVVAISFTVHHRNIDDMVVDA
jgi:hypothetical protein